MRVDRADVRFFCASVINASSVEHPGNLSDRTTLVCEYDFTWSQLRTHYYSFRVFRVGTASASIHYRLLLSPFIFIRSLRSMYSQYLRSDPVRQQRHQRETHQQTSQYHEDRVLVRFGLFELSGYQFDDCHEKEATTEHAE